MFSPSTVSTKAFATPNSGSVRAMYRPKGSLPVRVMTAASAPWRAAAMATFVALPPTDFEKVETSSSGPVCCG